MSHLTVCVLVGCSAVLPVTSAAQVKVEGRFWLIENKRLVVSVDPLMGAITVRDKGSGYLWRQPTATGQGVRVVFRRAATAPAVDGDLKEWTMEPTAVLTFTMTADAKKVDSDRDCSAQLWCAWDAEKFFLAARVWDEMLKFGEQRLKTWWERDSLEFWVGGRQVGLNLHPTCCYAMAIAEPLPDAQVSMRRTSDGYTVEAALTWKSLGLSASPATGWRFPFAFGVNDADATDGREGQLYFPSTWIHSAPDTFAEAILADEKGNLPTHSASDKPAQQPKFRKVGRLPHPQHGISFESDFGATRGRPNTVAVSLSLPREGADLLIEADMSDRDAEVSEFAFLEPFLLDTTSAVLAVADYGNGHIYPLEEKVFPRSFSADRLDMPWVGVCDLTKGLGYALILETSDDAAVRCNRYFAGNGRTVAAPQVIWRPSKGRFAYPRRLRYHFVSAGSYVALAKAYRAFAREQGLIVPFAEKLKKNPNIRRLFGAPDVWGNATLAFAQEAKAAGVDKMLIHGRSSAEQMQGINALGYLTSEYDNYTDILPVEEGKEVDSHHDHLPDAAVRLASGQRMTAWLTWDKKTQFMKRCPALWVRTAQIVVPKVLKDFPFIGRFIDVTTAEGLYECYDEKHPLTRSQKRQCGVELLSYVRANGLVVGGEHGIWWAVPVLDYIEGMMSGGYASWPAGHLIHPKSKEEEFTNPWGGKMGGKAGWEAYEKWGIGHEWRVPLWELVFHDCIVSTWYWGDASDFLLQAAPEVTPKKDAFNILYGTIPLLWADTNGSWRNAREVFLRTYRNTCKLHETIAGTEMLSHEFLTPDHAVQRTRFSDGTVVIVNFGEKPYPVPKGSLPRVNQSEVLPQNGFIVKGPRIEQSLTLLRGKAVTKIKTGNYLFTDEGGVELTLRTEGRDHLRIHIGQAAGRIVFRPADLVPGWDMASTRIFTLDSKGERVTHVHWRRNGDKVEVGPFSEAITLDVICRTK